MSEYLSLNQIIEAKDIVERDVEVPEWGGKVRIRALTKDTHQRIREASTKRGKRGQRDLDISKLELLLVVASLIEPKLEAVQYHQLKEKSSGAIERILDAINELNGLGVAAEEDIEDEVYL